MKKQAEALRAELKKAGYNSRKVSVTCDDGSLVVRIKDINADFLMISKLAERYEDIRRCDVTNEILSGGNTFVDIYYDCDVQNQIIYLRKDQIVDGGVCDGIKIHVYHEHDIKLKRGEEIFACCDTNHAAIELHKLLMANLAN